MRSIMTLVAAATLIADAAQAQAQCPTAVTDAVLRSFGPVIASDGGDRTVHQVTGLRMLGRPVPHVMVERRYGALRLMRYRLGQDVRVSGESVAADLAARFEASYRGSTGCGYSDCTAYPELGDDPGSLQYVELRELDVPVDDGWTGPGVAALAAQDEDALYLSCEYRGD